MASASPCCISGGRANAGLFRSGLGDSASLLFDGFIRRREGGRFISRSNNGSKVGLRETKVVN